MIVASRGVARGTSFRQLKALNESVQTRGLALLLEANGDIETKRQALWEAPTG